MEEDKNKKNVDKQQAAPSASQEPLPKAPKEQDDEDNSKVFVYMCIGLSLGVALGLVFDNIAMGITLGISFGLLAGVLIDNNDKKNKSKEDKDNKENKS